MDVFSEDRVSRRSSPKSAGGSEKKRIKARRVVLKVSDGKPRAAAVFMNSSLAGIICCPPAVTGLNTAGSWGFGSSVLATAEIFGLVMTGVF